MTRPVITKDSRGAYKPVTVEHEVINTPDLVNLQEFLKRQLSGFRPNSRTDLHFTLFHFGKPQEIYQELKAKNTALKAHDFWQNFWGMLADSAELVNHPFALSGYKLGLFGNHESPTLALELKATKKILASRIEAEHIWRDFLATCGLDREYKTAKPFRPHVSLGRLGAPAELPAIEPVMVKFTPSHLRNVVRSADGE